MLFRKDNFLEFEIENPNENKSYNGTYIHPDDSSQIHSKHAHIQCYAQQICQCHA